MLVALACKGRDRCPSCGARRMCDVAANVTDAVLPDAPERPWVLSLRFELRGFAATKPDVLTALGRLFAEKVERVTRRLAGVAGAATGAVSKGEVRPAGRLRGAGRPGSGPRGARGQPRTGRRAQVAATPSLPCPNRPPSPRGAWSLVMPLVSEREGSS